MSDIKKGYLVTIDLGPNNDASNTYIVYDTIGDMALLEHPMCPGVLIYRKLEDLNKTQAVLKNSLERCLDYTLNNEKYLDYKMQTSLQSLCLYFVVNKKFSTKQKQELANLTGIIAAIELNYDINAAIRLVKNNKGVLDYHNRTWFVSLERFFIKPEIIDSKKQSESIFNIAGFVLSQLHTK